MLIACQTRKQSHFRQKPRQDTVLSPHVLRSGRACPGWRLRELNFYCTVLITLLLKLRLTLGLLPNLDAVSLRCSRGPQVMIILSVAVGEKVHGRGCAVSLPSADLHGRTHIRCQEHAYSGESPLKSRKIPSWSCVAFDWIIMVSIHFRHDL